MTEWQFCVLGGFVLGLVHALILGFLIQGYWALALTFFLVALVPSIILAKSLVRLSRAE